MNYLRGLGVCMFAVIVVVSLAACGDREQIAGSSETAPDKTSSTKAAVERLPQIDLVGLKQLVAETAAKDQVLVIDFWATWCVPCVQMFPQLHEQIKAMGDRVRLVSVTIDAGPYEQKAIEFLHNQHALDDAFMLVPDTDARLEAVAAIGERWKSLVVPAILVFDQQGILAGEFLDGTVDPIVAKVEHLTRASEQAAK